MAEARTSSPRIRLPKVRFPTRSKGTGPSPAKKPPPAAESESPTPPKGKAPEPNLVERMEGLQGWMAEIERKQGRMTYFGAAGILIAILAAGAALYFGITNKSDSATKDDLDALETKVSGLEQAVTKSNQQTQQTLNSTITGLQTSIQTLQKQVSEDAAKISTLQSQASSGALKGAAATPVPPVTPGATVKPGTTTTTPAGK
jgi:uncharacterized protein HemX